MAYFFGALLFGLPALFLLCRVAIDYQHFSHRRSAGPTLHRFGISSFGAVRSGNWRTVLGKALLWCGAVALYLFLFELPWFALVFVFAGIGHLWRSVRRDQHVWLGIVELLLVVGFGLGFIAAPIVGVVAGVRSAHCAHYAGTYVSLVSSLR